MLTDERKGQGPIGARCGRRARKKLQAIPLRIARPNPALTSWQRYQPIMTVMTKQLYRSRSGGASRSSNHRAGTVDLTASESHRPPQPQQPPLGVVAREGERFCGWVHDPQGHHPGRRVPDCPSSTAGGQVIAPDLTNVGARRNAESDPQKDPRPASSVTKGYEQLAGSSPKSFGTMMNARSSKRWRRSAAHK